MLVAAAIVFSAATVLYNGMWLVAMRLSPLPAVELGFDADITAHEQAVRVVRKGSPAERAGLAVGDRIIAIDGAALTDEGHQAREWRRHQPGDSVRLTVRRRGVDAPLILTGVFRRRLQMTREVSRPELMADEFRRWYPLPFVLVGLAALFARIEEPRVWLLAVLLAAFAAQAGGHEQIAAMAPAARGFTMGYRAVLHGLFAPFFYIFCATFPVRSAIDRRAPWLKAAAVALGLCFAAFGFARGGLGLPPAVERLLGARGTVALYSLFGYVLLTGGLAALAWTYFHVTEAQARRKIRVIFWGTAVGVGPAILVQAFRDMAGIQAPWWLDTAVIALLFVFPLSLAYAVVRHRVLEIPVLLRRSARYMLVQRGSTFLLWMVSIGAAAAFASEYARRAPGSGGGPAGIAVGMVFGTVLLWRVSEVQRRVSVRIDRAFFRQAYDARVILEELAASARTARDRGELVGLMEAHLRKALQPDGLAIYLDKELRELPEMPALDEAARLGRTWECPVEGKAAEAIAVAFKPLRPECLAPIAGREGRLMGLIALGRRRSDEPYSGEDRRLLASVASQAAVALENLQLAQEIAARIETQRAAAREMEIAREVQARLLPQAAPRMRTLECAARCVQARSVGGDYYDFVRAGAGQVGLVLGDVSGKGVHAALLMANLQAAVRTLSSVGALDPAAVMREANRVLWESTAPEHFATVFFGVYDDESRVLTYVNAGHNPPVWITAAGEVRRLPATATVIGILQNWASGTTRIQLAPGDLVAVYSDGITEAALGEDDEFGEERLITGLLERRGAPAEAIVDGILRSVQEFSAGTPQSDDLTLLVGKVR